MTTTTQVRPSLAVWFEIPAADLDRAIAFYSRIFDIPLKAEQFGPDLMAVFPRNDSSASTGCVVYGPGRKPGGDGPIVYLNADGQLEALLARVEGAGGSILVPLTALPGTMGSYAVLRDSEGNTVGVHAAA
jgi:predicted enzyme related to lactoylglutathione lyase